MTDVRTWLFVALAFAACDSERERPPPFPVVDATPRPPCAACDPVMQTGCWAGEKCTWIRGGECGDHVGCALSGTVALANPCGFRDDGVDSCVKAAVCVASECRAICGLPAGPSSCASFPSTTCTEVDAFTADGSHFAGVCVP